MGRTMPSITQALQDDEETLSRFKRALRLADQCALEELFTLTKQHKAAAANAGHTLPMEIFLLAMLLEEHKTVMRLRAQIQALQNPGMLFIEAEV